MKEILLHQMLRSLTAEEFGEFVAFADSPFFNRDKRVVGLLERLQKAHPEFADSPGIAMNTLVKALGLGSEGNLRQMYTRTAKLLREFFVQKELSHQPNTARLLRLDALLHRHLDKDFRRELKDFAGEINLDDRPFHAQFRLDDFHLQQLSQDWEGDLVFSAYIESGNRYFLLKKLKQACQLLLLQRIYKKKEDHDLLRELDFLLPFHEKTVQGNAVLNAWRQMFDLLKSTDTKGEARSLWQFVGENRSSIPAKEQKDLHNTFNNYLIGRLNRGHFSTLNDLNWFYENLAGLYRFATDSGLLREGGHIPHQRFKNVVSVACIAGQTDWARNFLGKNIENVLPEFREDLDNFCLGSILFYENDFKNAAAHLAAVSSRGNEFYFFDLASLQMRIFLWENELDPFEARAEAVRKKLARSSLSDYHRENYANYFRLLKEFLHLRIHPATDAAAWAAFRQKVENTDPVNQKKWLLENIPWLTRP